MGGAQPLSEEEYLGEHGWVADRYREFHNSEQFDELSEEQQDNAFGVINFFADYLFTYEYTTFEECTSEHVEHVCTRLMPAKVAMEAAYFEHVPPVLATFFRFLETRGEIDNGAELADRVESIADSLLEAADDPANWGMGKSALLNGEIDHNEIVHLDDLMDDEDRSDAGEDIDLGVEADVEVEVEVEPGQGAGGDGAVPLEFEAKVDSVSNQVVENMSAQSREVVEKVNSAERRFELAHGRPPVEGELDDLCELAGVTRSQYEAAVDETDSLLDAALEEQFGEFLTMTGPDVLDHDEYQRFNELFVHLLAYANDELGVSDEIDSADDYRRGSDEARLAIRNALFFDSDSEFASGFLSESGSAVGSGPTGTAIITSYVEDNPDDFSEEQLDQLRQWTHYECGTFGVVEHREAGSVFLDLDAERAYTVKSCIESTETWLPSGQLPKTVKNVVLLPFEGQIVSDGWMRPTPYLDLPGQVSPDEIDTTYERVMAREDLITSLPPEAGRERPDDERLAHFVKTADNREQFGDEIEQLREKSEALERLYHAEFGKSKARSLGREFRDLDLQEAYVAIYEGRVVATAPTEDELESILEGIMPDGRADYPYVYHYDP